MSLNLRQLEVVRAICHFGSATGAAAALGITQPAISMMLREANRAAGIPLFVRRHGRLQPTAETTVLVADLDRVLGGIERINRLVAEMKDARVGTIQVAATPTLAENLVTRAVAVFQSRRPNVRIAIHAMDNREIIASVVHEEVDLGLVLSPTGHVETRCTDLCTAPLVCVVHPESASGATNNAIIQDSTGPAPGSVVMAFPGNGGCDMAWYNPGNNKYFTACSNANPGPQALFVTDAGSFAVQRLATGLNSGAHSVASDPVNFNAYVPVSSASTSGLCSSKGAVDANGCILVYAPTTQPVATHDVNGDHKSDIVWRDTSGNTAGWLMNGAAVLSSGAIGAIPTSWTIVGQRDFDGDGKADLLWRDTSGNTAMWFMNGTTVASSAGVGNVSTVWSVNSTADFNGDGKGDLLWRDTSGNLAMWLMNGAAVASSAGLGNVPNTLTIIATADFNGDGKADILWRDSNGNLSMWFMNGTTVVSSAGVGNLSTVWSLAGTGDFDGDGMADIAWRDTLGNTLIWLMHGATVFSTGSLGLVPTTTALVLTGDFNGDGMSDLLWRDNLGNTSIWFMNGTAVKSSAGLGNISTVWTVQSANAE
jgi:DNA-binding transcriptional LysR family regulator